MAQDCEKMKKKILVLNIEVSGMNKYLFAQLRRYGWELDIHDIPLPKRLRYWALFISFFPVKSLWKKRFDYHRNKLIKSSWCFKWRTKWCERLLKEKESQYDLVLNMTGMSAPAVDYEKLPNLKYFIVTSYNMILSKKYEPWCPYPHEFKKWVDLEKKLYRNAGLIFTTNENARKSLIRDYSVDTQKVIKMGYGLTFDDFPEFEKHYDGKTILFTGFDFNRKGGFLLLDAFREVRRHIKGARLIIIGPDKEIYKINEEGVGFLGPVKDRKKMQEYYKQASVFAMPSLCEPFGLVMLEAMAYKLPCIGSSVDAMAEIVDDGVTGYLMRSFDPDELSKKLIILLSDKQKMKAMGAAAFNKVKEGFAWENVGDVINIHLERVVKDEK